MSNGVTIEIKGLEKAVKTFNQMPTVLQKKVSAGVELAANNFMNRAVKDAPVDQARLRQGITVNKKGQLSFEIVSSAKYSAYIEFGTKKRFTPIAGVDSSQFKGKGDSGDYFDFLNAILDWVKRKGIASRFSVKTRKQLKHTKSDDDRLVETAQAIANSIIRHGIKAHPFFFKQYALAEKEMNLFIDEALKESIK